ncbi:peptidoglycan DD-metalloendopeptidase family protein [Leptolyngbya sp. FACHB-1515]
MVGLALSMGAASLLLPRQNDGAIAAEPQAAEPQAAIAPAESPAAVAPPEAAPAPESANLHRVRSGQTLRQIARKYRVDLQALATANGLSPNSTLTSGQMLTIPADAAPEAAIVPVSAPAADNLKLEQDRALASMRQERDRLEANLSEFKVESSPPEVAPAADEAISSEAAPSEVASSASLPVEEATVEPSAAVESPAAIEPSIARAPALRPEPISQPQAISHRVTPGDTLGKIADLYNISQRTLAEANGLSNPNLIVVNQVLTIPTSTLPPETIQSASTSRLDPDPAVAGNSSQYYPMVTVPTVPNAPSPAASPSGAIAAVPPAAELTEADTATVAVASPSAAPAVVPVQPATASSEAASNPYIERLMAEIVTMRERYRNGERAAAQPVVVPTVPAPVQVAAAPIARPPAAPIDQPNAATPPVSPAASPTSPSEQLVAVAPLGAQNYTSPVTGRLVSPDLPPLPSAEAYLPQGAPVFNGYRWPARGVLTSGYGWRWGRMHRGIDIGAPTGTPVVAAAAGEVVFAGWNSGGFGNLVDIRHPDGSLTRYAHNSRILVRRGQQVEQGQQISAIGSTGNSTGPHLHFEVHPPNRGAVNPIALLPRSRD